MGAKIDMRFKMRRINNGNALAVAALAAAVFTYALGVGSQEKDGPERVRMVYLPILGKEETLERFEPVTSHLEKGLGLPVDAVSFASYNKALLHLVKGDFEVAYLGPATFVKVSRAAKLEVVAMELDSAGRKGYYSVLISRADSGIKTLEDGRGKVLAFTDTKSTSGFLVPVTFFLRELKTTPGSFAKKVEFSGDHESLIKGVYQGEYDIGATGTVDLARTMEAEQIPEDALRVIWKSEIIPGPPVCARADLPEGFKKSVQQALVSLDDEKVLEALQIGGFAPASGDDYKLIKSLEWMEQ